MGELADLTRELVAIPSHESEAAAGDFLEDWLRANTDAAVRRDTAGAEQGRGGNVIARKEADPEAPDHPDGFQPGTLAFVGHHDVVPPDDEQVTPDGEYAIAEREGRLHGRGTADMKGAVAAMALAFRDADPAGELVFASFVGEEVGGVGARSAIEAGFAPDWAVVAEGSTGYSAPGVTDVAVAHKGRRAVTVTATGESAHASNPEAGENAIYRACDAVDALREVAAPSVTVARESLAGSLVVTGIDGGSAWNVVPAGCSITVDERTVPGERVDLEAVLGGLPGIAWTIDQDLPPMRCGDEAFAEAVLGAARAVQDPAEQDPAEDDSATSRPQLVTKPHATDAGWLADRARTDCVVCGPAEPGEAHTAAESVSLSVLERCRAIYREVATRWPARA